jgi:hypothetical protein
MLITIIGLLAAALTSLSLHPASEDSRSGMPVKASRDGTHHDIGRWWLDISSSALQFYLRWASASSIIDKMLRAFLGQHLSRLVRHVRLLAQGLNFVALRYPRFCHRRSLHVSRISSINFDACALVRLSSIISGVPACSQRVFK